MSFKICSLCVKVDDLWILEWLKERAKLEGISVSELVRRAVKEYIERHKSPNPQTQLIPSPPPIYMNPVLEAQRDLLAELTYDLRNRGQRPVERVLFEFAYYHGLTLKNVRKMLNLIKLAGKI